MAFGNQTWRVVVLTVLRSSQSSHPNWEVTSVPLNLEEPSSIVQLLLLWPSSQILSFLICNVLIKSMKESNSAWHKSSSSRYITVIWFVGMCVCQHACVHAHMNVCSCGSQKASSGIVPQILSTRVFCFFFFFFTQCISSVLKLSKWLASDPQHPRLLQLSSSGFTSKHSYPWDFAWEFCESNSGLCVLKINTSQLGFLPNPGHSAWGLSSAFLPV